MQSQPADAYTDGGDVTLRVSVICETQQQTRLSDTGVTDQQKLSYESRRGKESTRVSDHERVTCIP